MLTSYNREYLSTSQKPTEAKIFFDGKEEHELEWNQYIGKIIINDFIKQLPQYEGTDFTTYIKDVVPFIQLGLFQSAIGIINGIDIPGLEKIKTWLLKSLAEGEDRDAYKQVID